MFWQAQNRAPITVDLILGNTLPTMLITMILAILAAKLTSGKEKDA